MTRRPPSQLALALLERFVSDSTPLAGDLLEEFERHQSSAWLWWQVLAAIATASFNRPDDIRPLRLVDLQPADAVQRSRRMGLRSVPVNLSASPLDGVGGLGLVVLALLLTRVLPDAWWVLLASMVAGVLLGFLMIVMHRSRISQHVTRMFEGLRPNDVGPITLSEH
jgi:hypothetical protein